jgi:hypothetical protein
VPAPQEARATSCSLSTERMTMLLSS